MQVAVKNYSDQSDMMIVDALTSISSYLRHARSLLRIIRLDLSLFAQSVLQVMIMFVDSIPQICSEFVISSVTCMLRWSRRAAAARPAARCE